MKYKFKARISVLALILFVFTFGQAVAADKVVVVPLMGGDVTEQQFDEQHVWTGWVGSDGSKSSTGAYTSSRYDDGSYIVTLNLDGFDIDYWDRRYPIAVFSVFAGGSAYPAALVSGNKNGKYTTAAVYVSTYNSTGTKIDRPFMFHIKFPGPNPPVAGAGLSSAETPLPEGMKCETVGEETTCTIDMTE